MDSASTVKARRLARAGRVESFVLGVLALVFAALVTLQYTVDLPDQWTRRISLALTLIWGLFAIDFFSRLILAPSKSQFLKANWMLAIGVLVPAFGFVRLFVFAPAAGLLHAGGAIAAGSQGSRSIRDAIGAHQTLYALLLTVFITLLSSAGMTSIERTRADANIQNYGDALWWTVSTLTTIGGELYPVSWEGRTLAICVMLYGLVFSGYVTAVLAVGILGPNAPGSGGSGSDDDDSTSLDTVLAELKALREQLGLNGTTAPSANGHGATAPLATQEVASNLASPSHDGGG